MASTSGLDILPRNCLAYEERLSAKRLCPSANKVSNANDDLPEPEIPVTTVNLLRGISTVIFLRLLTFAPFMMIFPLSGILDRFSPQIYIIFPKHAETSDILTMFLCQFVHIRAILSTFRTFFIIGTQIDHIPVVPPERRGGIPTDAESRQEVTAKEGIRKTE